MRMSMPRAILPRILFLVCAGLVCLMAGQRHACAAFRKEWFGVSDRKKMGLVYEAKGAPFTCYATSRETAERGLRVAAAAYGRCLEKLGSPQRISRNIIVCLWDDEQSYKKYAAMYYLGAHGAFAFASRNILPDTDAVLGYVRKHFFEETLPHEIAHIVLYNLFDPSGNTNLPSWIHEGFAQLQEGNIERSKEKACIEIINAMEEERYLPIWQLTAPEKPSSSPGVFYAEALMFVDFLMRNQVNDDSFWKLCYYVSRNRKREFKFYFRNYYPQFKDMDDIEARWREFIRRYVRGEARRKLRRAAENIARGKRLCSAGRKEEALGCYREGFSGLSILFRDYTRVEEPLFNRARALSLIKACSRAVRSIRPMETTVKVLPGCTQRDANERLSGFKRRTSGEGWIYDDIGLAMRFDEADRITVVTLTKPRAGSVGGIKVGDKLEELLMLRGVFDPGRVERMEKAFLKGAAELVPRPDMNCFEEGSYPLLDEAGRFSGILIREAIDPQKQDWDQGKWFFADPFAPRNIIACIDLEGDDIAAIELCSVEYGKRLFARRVLEGSRRILPREGGTGLRVGDKKDRLVRYLGVPKKSAPYAIPEISRVDSYSSRGYRYRKSIKTDSKYIKAKYPGLEVIMCGGYIISLWARAPSHASIYGVRIGDPLKAITKRLGSTDALVKYERKKRAGQLEKKEGYMSLFLKYRRGKADIHIRIDHEGKASSIYAYATEWRGKRWGDTFVVN